MLKAMLVLLATAVPHAAAALEFGEWQTANGSNIKVEEDFMDARYPRLVVILRPDNWTERDGVLVLRCEQNQTEVYFSSGPLEFFGHSRDPVVAVRFPSDERAVVQSVDLSTDGEAVFFDNAIGFMSRLATDGSVGLDGNYFGSSFRHRFTVDGQLVAAIRDLATTCEWADRLPEAPIAAVVEPAPEVAKSLSDALRALVAEHGAEAVRAALADILPPPAK